MRHPPRRSAATVHRRGAAHRCAATLEPVRPGERVGPPPRHARLPLVLTGDPGAPAVLFSRGDASAVERQARVAIVGTASPTPYGLQVASQMAAELADGGVTVVSSLSAGIDGAAQAGVVRSAGPSAARPVAVAGTGLDQPGSHDRALWSSVASMGVIFSEATLGTPPNPGDARAESLRPSRTWSSWWRANPTARPTRWSRRPYAGPYRSAPYPGRSGAGPRSGPISCWSMGALPCATVPTSSPPCIWPAPAGARRWCRHFRPTDRRGRPLRTDPDRRVGGRSPEASRRWGPRPAVCGTKRHRHLRPGRAKGGPSHKSARTGTGGWSRVPVAPPH